MENRKNKAYGLLGFAARSGNLVTGYNTCLKLITSGKLKLLILGRDVGDNTKEKLSQKCKTYSIPVRVYGTCEELSHITGKEDKGVFGITDKGFSKSIAKAIDESAENTGGAKKDESAENIGGAEIDESAENTDGAKKDENEKSIEDEITAEREVF